MCKDTSNASQVTPSDSSEPGLFWTDASIDWDRVTGGNEESQAEKQAIDWSAIDSWLLQSSNNDPWSSFRLPDHEITTPTEDFGILDPLADELELIAQLQAPETLRTEIGTPKTEIKDQYAFPATTKITAKPSMNAHKLSKPVTIQTVTVSERKRF